MKDESARTTDLDAEVESQTAVPLPSREVMSIVDPTLGPKLFPQAASPSQAAADVVDPDASQS